MLCLIQTTNSDRDTDNTTLVQSYPRLRPPGDTVHLWHPYSKRFVAASQSISAITDNGHSRVEMSASNSFASQFVICPRFKVRAGGDPVRKGDEIMLESCLAPGQYLHPSARVLICPEESAMLHCSEVACSTQVGSFALSTYRRQSSYASRQPFSPLEAYLWRSALRGEVTPPMW